MKKLSITILMTISTIFSTFSFNEDVEKAVKNNLRNKINTLLGNYKNELKSNVTATIEFMLNNENEIVVLSVTTDVKNIASFVKQKLNYKKADVKNAKALEIYTLPIKFVKA